MLGAVSVKFDYFTVECKNVIDVRALHTACVRA